MYPSKHLPGIHDAHASFPVFFKRGAPRAGSRAKDFGEDEAPAATAAKGKKDDAWSMMTMK
jgi:hypothetical protein